MTNWCAKCPHWKHARACKTCGCAYRSKPRKRIPARNVVRRDPVAASAQREAVLARGVATECLRYADTAFCGQAPLGVKHAANRVLKYLDMDGPPSAWDCFFKGCDRVGIHVLGCPLSTLKAREKNDTELRASRCCVNDSGEGT